MCRNLAPTNIMKIIELPTIARHSPVFECENCGRQSLICQLHRRANSRRLSCHCGKDSINLPQNASDWKVTRNIEHESTCDPVGRDGLGDFSLPNDERRHPLPATPGGEQPAVDSNPEASTEERVAGCLAAPCSLDSGDSINFPSVGFWDVRALDALRLANPEKDIPVRFILPDPDGGEARVVTDKIPAIRRPTASPTPHD